MKGRFAPIRRRLTEPMMISVMAPRTHPPRTHPPVDLAAFAKEHLSYEAKMFAMSRDRHFYGVAQGLDLNVFLESCILHLRNLIDFFYPTKVHPDDVIAMDYAPNWDTQCPPISSVLKVARKRARKELARLTTARKTPSSPDKDWDFGSVSKEMKPVIDAFIRLAHPGTLPSETVTALNAVASIPTVLVVTGKAALGSSLP
jgi:hypothetical protein